MARHRTRSSSSTNWWYNTADIGISSIRMQEWPDEDCIYDKDTALCRGTLFPILDMPVRERGGGYYG
ncbi:MAG: spore coat associated protein CotJA [Erysipelotrichaceae bacterium]|nr:spore coat associated protein CotJA [Erysipelotrichaceae bacterium]